MPTEAEPQVGLRRPRPNSWPPPDQAGDRGPRAEEHVQEMPAEEMTAATIAGGRCSMRVHPRCSCMRRWRSLQHAVRHCCACASCATCGASSRRHARASGIWSCASRSMHELGVAREQASRPPAAPASVATSAAATTTASDFARCLSWPRRRQQLKLAAHRPRPVMFAAALVPRRRHGRAVATLRRRARPEARMHRHGTPAHVPPRAAHADGRRARKQETSSHMQ